MRAAVLKEFGGDVAVYSVPDPSPGVGQVLVAVEACGEVFGRIVVDTTQRR